MKSDEFIDATEQAYALLAERPGVGSLRSYDNPALTGMRMWPVPGFRNYLIFYLSDEERLIILHVLHGARDIEAIFAPEEE